MQHHSPLFRWLATSACLILGAVAPSIHDSDQVAYVPFSLTDVEKTLAFAFSAMAERHLEPIHIADVALEGLRGLANIDPQIGIEIEARQIRLTASDHVVADYPRPADGDARSWARLVVTLAVEARPLSPALAASGAEDLYQAVIDATLSRLDTFSRYSGQAEAREHRAARNGFGGLGIRFEISDDEAHITEVMDDTPAAAAQLQVGDIITHIDGDSLAGMSKDQISHILRGPVASDIALTIRRGYRPMDILLHRALIVPPTVFSSLQQGVGVLRITAFNQRTATGVKQELTRLQGQNGAPLVGLVLDLRGNPGGLLDQAVDVADLFMAEGVIVATRGRHALSSQSYEAHGGDAGESLPLVVLMDGKTASAAEILAAALQDAARAVLVGSNSYGKGTVQTVIRLPNDGEMTLTWSRFHSSTGYALHNLGVMPNLCTVSGAAMFQADAADIRATLSLWRHSQVGDVDMRPKLRATCPATTLESSPTESNLALHLLRHPDAYAAALSLSPSMAQPKPEREKGALLSQ